MSNDILPEAPVGYLAHIYRKAWDKADTLGQDGERSHAGVRAILEAYEPYVYTVLKGEILLTAAVNIDSAVEIAEHYGAASITVWANGLNVGLLTPDGHEWQYEAFNDVEVAE